MATAYSVTQKAAGKLQLVLLRLATDYPFHVKVLEQFRLVERPDVGTMGVMVDGDYIALFFNPTFVLETPMSELGGVLLHEVHHVVLGHVLADLADFPDESARTVAEEVTVNEFVKEPLPVGAIMLADYPKLPPLESTRERYERLRKVKRRPPIDSPRAEAQTREAVAGASEGRPQNAGQAHLKTASKKHGSSGHQAKKADQRPGSTTVDDHAVWREGSPDHQQGKKTIQNVVEKAIVAVGWDHVPPELHSAIAAAGIEPGDEKQPLAGEGRGKLNWRHLLRRYVGQIVEIRPVFNRPSRRFPEMVGIIPGSRRQSVRPKIMAVIDTSGSLTDELLNDISAELAGLARNFDVLVVECDAAIHRVYAYRRPLKDVFGRGGTDFRPPLERNFLTKHRPDLIIYFTDGRGTAPKGPPGTPVIWCLVPGGQMPVSWGKEVTMKNA